MGARLAASCLLLSYAMGCSSEGESAGAPLLDASADAADSGHDGGAACPLPSDTFPAGDALGHSDPYGAKAAGQARAGRLTSESLIVQPAHGRQQIQLGDVVLINDKIAVVIEDVGTSDGLLPFGGGIVAIDKVGGDGRPLGLSNYLETMIGLSIEMVKPTSVSIINDGSDGKAAVVRAAGPLTPIPFLEVAVGKLFARRFGLQAAYDYVLEPGAEAVSVRLGLINPDAAPVEFNLAGASAEMYAFMHTSKSQLVSIEHGFDTPSGESGWYGFVSGEWNFAIRPTAGERLDAALQLSGVNLAFGPGFSAEACATTWVDHLQLIGGGPHYDGLREAIRRVDNDASWREIRGTVSDASGAAVGGVFVHELGLGGAYLSRTLTEADGSFSIHAPQGDVQLIPQKRGYPEHAGSAVDPAATSADLTFAAHGTLHVAATDQATGAALPVRIQVIPETPPPPVPAEYGVSDESQGRLHQEYAPGGSARLVVPPGIHRVVVSRGSEWEISDTTADVAAGANVPVVAALEHSVDSAGYLCGDFHIHSNNSVDSTDPIEYKVRGALADGLDIAASSEHDWAQDFQPTVEALGMTSFLFGMPSDELTSFDWGHVGIVPLSPRPGAVNNGAPDWTGKSPPDLFAEIQALPEDPILIINHPNSPKLQSYFNYAEYDRTTGGGNALWSDGFDAIEVFNESDFEENRDRAVADWFSLLNHGKSYIAVGNSDSHQLRKQPVGYPRTCIYFGHDDLGQLTPAVVKDALASGDVSVSGGLFMSVVGSSGERPGQVVIGAGASATLTVTVWAASFVDATKLELIVNGVTQDVQDLMPLASGTAKRFVNVVTAALDPGRTRNWVVFHAKGERDLSPLHPGRRPFAVSNPIFFQ